MPTRDNDLIVEKLAQVEKLMELANSILTEIKGELAVTEKETHQHSLKDVICDPQDPQDPQEQSLTAFSLCQFINHDPSYRNLESEVLSILDKGIESSSRTSYFISGYLRQLRDIDVVCISQLRSLVNRHKSSVLQYAKSIECSGEGNGTVIYGVALHYLLTNYA